MAKELSFKPTGKLHDEGILYQDFDILLGNKKINRYDFSFLQVGNVMLKFDMKADGTVRIRLMSGAQCIEKHPLEKHCSKSVMFIVKEDL